MGRVISSYLMPNVSSDNLSIEHYSDSNARCVELIKQDVEELNQSIAMSGLVIESIIEKAINSRTA